MEAEIISIKNIIKWKQKIAQSSVELFNKSVNK